MIKDNRIQSVLEQYHQRMNDESMLIKSLSHEIGHSRRNEFLLSIGKETAELLYLLLISIKPKCILEIGTSYGYSTIWLGAAAATYGGKVITLEIEAKKSDYAKVQAIEAGLDQSIQFYVGDAVSFIENSNDKFDFVLLDIWKELYQICFDKVFPKLSRGGYIISDNMLLPAFYNEEMETYRSFIKNNFEIDSVLLPIGSGIEISLKK